MKLKKMGNVFGIVCICMMASCGTSEPGESVIAPSVTNGAEVSENQIEKVVTKAPTEETKKTEFANVTEVVVGEVWELGNLQGNLLNEGWVCENDGEIYYRDYNHDNFLCKMNPDGSGKQVLAEEIPRAIQVVGDWVYFIDDDTDGEQWGRIKRVGKNGGEVTVIGEDKAAYMFVSEEEIIYNSRDIKKMNIDGSGSVIVQKYTGKADYAWLSIYGNCVFTEEMLDGKRLYAVKLDGSGQYLLDEGVLYPTVSGGTLWYSGKGGALTALSLVTGEKKVWSGTYAMRSIRYKDTIYYHKLDGIYAIQGDEKESVKIYPKDSGEKHFIELFWVAADKIYFCDYITEEDTTTTFQYMDLATGEVGIVP